MNFYNPYYFPYQTIAPRTGLFKGLLSRINFGSILGGTQKTLNTINQVIPLVKQARPMMDNAKTLFRLMSEFNKGDATTATATTATATAATVNEIKKTVPEETVNEVALESNSNGPTFFL